MDVDDALKRIGGNMGLYIKLLGRFVEDCQLDELEKALKKNEFTEASRMAHTIKGVAANLSLVKLRAKSADLELAIGDELKRASAFEEFKKTYGMTVQIISDFIAHGYERRSGK